MLNIQVAETNAFVCQCFFSSNFLSIFYFMHWNLQFLCKGWLLVINLLMDDLRLYCCESS